MWSGWKCEMTMVSIAAGSMPATARLSIMTPAVSATWPAVPQSIRTSFDPVLTSSTVNEIGRTLGGRNAAASALLTSARLELRTKLVVDLHRPEPVVQRGELEIAELVAIDARALRGRLRRGGEHGSASHRGSRRAGQQVTSGQFGHFTSPFGVKTAWQAPMLGQIVSRSTPG